MERIMITGGCGFVGHHMVEHFIKNSDAQIIVVDKLSYAANGFDRLRDINCFDEQRVSIFPVDLNLPMSVGVMREVGDVDYIVNLASDSHVDSSIANPVPFVQNNVNLVLSMLEYARLYQPNLKKFIQFSTDEVYGAAEENFNYWEGMRFNPSNPYSASKAAQEAICTSYAHTYGLPINITNTMNVIGERQHPEKFVPKVMRSILNGDTITIHADATCTKPGSRFYIHARNVAQGIDFLLHQPLEKMDKYDASLGRFNIVGEVELDNLTLCKLIRQDISEFYKQTFALNYQLVSFHSSRPGHDLRYALDGTKMKNLGWTPPMSLFESLRKTVEWTLTNHQWLAL